jgi:hypothetical protein
MRHRRTSELSSEGSFDSFLGTVTKNGLGMLILVAMASTFSSQLTLGQAKFKHNLGTPMVRTAPLGTKAVGFEIRADRVFPVDYEPIAQIDKDYFGAFDRGANMQETAQQFNAKGFAHAYYKLEFKAQSGEPDLPNEPAIYLHPKPGPLGETLDEAQKPDSVFRKRLQGIDKNTGVVFFRVWSDSFKTFRDLRGWLQQEGYPQIGWAPTEKSMFFLHPRFGGGGPKFD